MLIFWVTFVQKALLSIKTYDLYQGNVYKIQLSFYKPSGYKNFVIQDKSIGYD